MEAVGVILPSHQDLMTQNLKSQSSRQSPFLKIQRFVKIQFLWRHQMILNFLILLIDQLLLKFGCLQSDVLLLTQPTNLIQWNFPGFGLHCPLPGSPHSNHYHC